MAGTRRPWAALRGCPGSTSTQCESRAARRRTGVVPSKRGEEHEEHPAARHSTCFLAAGIRPRARHGRARTYYRPCGGPGSTSTKSDGRTARRRTASPLSSTRPARAPQSWRSTNTLSHRGHVTTVLPRGSTPYRRVCPFASPTRVMLRQGNLWRAVTRGIEEECTRSRAGRLHKTRVSSCAWAAGTGLSPYEGRLAAR